MYTFNPSLPFVRKDYQGNLMINGRFSNDGQDEKPSFKEVMKWQFSHNPNRKTKKEAKKNGFIPVDFHKNNQLFQTKENAIAWLGHASFFIRINGMTLLTDPCLEDLPFFPRWVPKPCDYEHMTNIRHILLSHGHRDHLDIKSLKNISKYNSDVSFLTPLGISKILKKVGTVTTQEAGWWQQYTLPQSDVKIILLPAKHWNRRGVRDYNTTLWGSFWIETPTIKLYFVGDTGYWSHFKEIRKVLGAPDIVFMPIGAYKPHHIMRYAHMGPEKALEAFHELGGKYFVPMHHGTYDLGRELLNEPIEVLRGLEEQGALDGQLLDLGVGELFYF